MVSMQPARRRASYGPTSPEVGERGGRTRDRIIAETLELFADIGFHDTTVRDIADASEVSRATLYQYFSSKDEIVNELREECSRALIEVVEAVGPIGPTAAGFDQLRRWIVAWSAVQARYGALFVRWAGVDLPGEEDDRQEGWHPDEFWRHLLGLLRAAGLSAMSPAEAGSLMTGVVHRYSFLRFAACSPRAREPGAVDEVATVLQRVLFPGTPRDVLVGVRADRHAPVSGLAVATRTRPSRLAELSTGLSDRCAQTVRLIVQAGAESCAEHGYHAANVDAIVRRAGFARGTFYKYFADKLSLLLVLADEFEDGVFGQLPALAQLPGGPEGSADRLRWVRELLAARDAHLGVMRSLIDRSPHDAELDEVRQRCQALLAVVLGTTAERAGVADVVTPWGAQVVVIGALDRRPTAELVTTVLERGLLGG